MDFTYMCYICYEYNFISTLLSYHLAQREVMGGKENLYSTKSGSMYPWDLLTWPNNLTIMLAQTSPDKYISARRSLRFSFHRRVQ